MRARCNANLQLVVLLDQDQDHDQEFLCDAYPAPDTQSTATRLAESLAPVNDFPKADVFFFEGTADIRCVAWCPPLRLNVFCGHCPCSFPLIALLASHPWALHLPEFVAATPPPMRWQGLRLKCYRVSVFPFLRPLHNFTSFGNQYREQSANQYRVLPCCLPMLSRGTKQPPHWTPGDPSMSTGHPPHVPGWSLYDDLPDVCACSLASAFTAAFFAAVADRVHHCMQGWQLKSKKQHF